MVGAIRRAIRRATCAHNWVFLRSMQVGAGLFSFWYCPRCGSVRRRREPWSWDDR